MKAPRLPLQRLAEFITKSCISLDYQHAFEPSILEQTNDPQKAYTGFAYCQYASHIAKHEIDKFLKENADEFEIVSPIKPQYIRGELHYFLANINQNHIIDVTARQQASTGWIDQTIHQTFYQLEEKEELSQDEQQLFRAIMHYGRAQRDSDKIDEMRLEIAEKIPPIFVGQKDELITLLKKSYQKIITPALEIPEPLALCLENNLPNFWAGNSTEWKVHQKDDRVIAEYLRLNAQQDEPDAKPSNPEAERLSRMSKFFENRS